MAAEADESLLESAAEVVVFFEDECPFDDVSSLVWLLVTSDDFELSCLPFLEPLPFVTELPEGGSGNPIELQVCANKASGLEST